MIALPVSLINEKDMFFIKLISLVFSIIPDCITMILARVISPLFYQAMKRQKWGLKIVRILPKVFPGRSNLWYDKMVRKNALHLMKFAGEMFKAHYKRDFWLARKCYIEEGREHLEALIRKNEGFIILTCHLGNWEYAAAWLAMRYRPIYAPVFVENSRGNEALNWIRRGHNVELLEASRDPRVSARSLLKMIHLLEKGEIIYIVGDQQALGGDYRGVFFRKELRIFGGPFILGEKTGRPVLPMYSIRKGDNRIALFFEEPFVLDGLNKKKDITRVTEFFERNISQYPDQYLWSQDRW